MTDSLRFHGSPWAERRADDQSLTASPSDEGIDLLLLA